MSEKSPPSSVREWSTKELIKKSQQTNSNTEDTPVPDLRLDVVRYEYSPDRGTVHPPDLTGIERMETWISVDMSVVADLSMWR